MTAMSLGAIAVGNEFERWGAVKIDYILVHLVDEWGGGDFAHGVKEG